MKPDAREDLADLALAPLRPAQAAHAARRRQRRGDLVQPEVSADLLGEVGLARHVEAPGRHERRGLGARSRDQEPERRERPLLLQPAAPRRRAARSRDAGRSRTVRAGRSPPLRSTRPGRTLAGADLGPRGARAGRAPAGPAAMSAPRSKRCEASVCMPSARAARRIASGSQQAASSATTRVASWISLDAPPMIPASASAGSPPLPAITPTRAGSVRSLPSSVVSALALARPAHDERPAGHAREVEGVARLAQLEHHVVREVDDVVDRAHAHELEPVAQPRRRGADRHVAARARRSGRTGRAPRSSRRAPRPPASPRPRTSCRAAAAPGRRAPPPRAPRRRRSCSRRGWW